MPPFNNLDLLLIYPPTAKPAEPPAGMAQIKTALQEHQFSCTTIDANIEGLHYLLKRVKNVNTPRLSSALRN